VFFGRDHDGFKLILAVDKILSLHGKDNRSKVNFFIFSPRLGNVLTMAIGGIFFSCCIIFLKWRSQESHLMSFQVISMGKGCWSVSLYFCKCPWLMAI
jgi:hypothetical protein